MSLYKGNNLISGAMPNSANKSLSNLDSAGQDIIDNKIDLDYSNADYQPVNKAGDTMTGDLDILKNNPNIILKNSNFTKGTNPSSNIYWEYLAEDGNTNPAEWYTNRVGNYQITAYPDGTVSAAMRAYQNNPNVSNAAVIKTEITSAGVASCSFPNTTCCDGQWKQSNQTVVNTATSLIGSSPLPYTLNLPGDNYNYMATLSVRAQTGSTSGNTITVAIGSDLVSSVHVCQTRTRTNSTVECAGCISIPVGTSHKIYVARSSGNTGNLTSLILHTYRRIGTNA